MTIFSCSWEKHEHLHLESVLHSGLVHLRPLVFTPHRVEWAGSYTPPNSSGRFQSHWSILREAQSWTPPRIQSIPKYRLEANSCQKIRPRCRQMILPSRLGSAPTILLHRRNTTVCWPLKCIHHPVSTKPLISRVVVQCEETWSKAPRHSQGNRPGSLMILLERCLRHEISH